MIQRKLMYTPSDKEPWKEKREDFLNALAPFLIAVGFLGMLFTSDKFAIAVKPAKDFERLLNGPVGLGDHIQGSVCFTYGCFAEESMVYSEHGKKTNERKNGYYYVIPGADGVLMLQVPIRYHDAMETLTEETLQYLLGGTKPQVSVGVNGSVEKNRSESLQRMLEEYLGAMGYPGQEIAGMGEVYIVRQEDGLKEMRNLFVICAASLAAGLILLLVRKREKVAVFLGKNKRNLSPEQEARLGNILTQVFTDRKIVIKQVAIVMAVGLTLASLICYFKSDQGYLTGSVVFSYAAAVLLGLCPLVGSRKYIIFYEHGMNYCGEAFLYEESGYPEFRTHLQENGKLTVFLELEDRAFNVSGMADFIAKYKRAYGIQ